MEYREGEEEEDEEEEEVIKTAWFRSTLTLLIECGSFYLIVRWLVEIQT